MSEALDLTCRCGWVGNFNTDQVGMNITCPECERPIHITDDPDLFRSRNVGDVDFSFEDDLDTQARNDELPDGASPRAALPPKIGRLASARGGPASQAPRRGTGKRGAGGGRGQRGQRGQRGARGAARGSGGGASGGGRAAMYHAAAPPGSTRRGPTRSQRKARHQVVSKSRGGNLMTWLLLGGVLCLLGVGGCVFWVYSVGSQFADGMQLGVAITEGAVNGTDEPHGQYFAGTGQYTAFRRDMQNVASKGGPITIQLGDAHGRSTDRFDLMVDLEQATRTHRITFDMERRNHGWMVLDYTVHEMSAAMRAR